MLFSSLLLCGPALAIQDTDYSYNPIGKRDPFTSFTQIDEPPTVGFEPTPLQLYDVDQLTVTGIVWEERDPSAMVLGPDNSVHVVEMGTYVGRYWGRVTAITRRSVVVTEEWLTMEPEPVTRQHTLDLKQDGALNLGR